MSYAVENGIAPQSYGSLSREEFDSPISRRDYVRLFYKALPASEYAEIKDVYKRQEYRGHPLGIWVIAVFIAAEFLQKADLTRLIPADEGETVKALDNTVRHRAAEGPLRHGLVLFVEILTDVPALHGPAGVPLVKPQLDFPAAVILRSPAFNVDGVGCKEEMCIRDSSCTGTSSAECG